MLGEILIILLRSLKIPESLYYLRFRCSNIVTVHVGQFLDELLPVLATQLNHRRIEAIDVHSQVALVSGDFEALIEVVPDCLTVAVGAHHRHDQVRFLLAVPD